tara:strand:- start:656 stop:1279 length:624 start_codon:yes stop_codon:yes gene_type:complete
MYKIKDFIGSFDGMFGDLCDSYIDYFKELEKNNLVWPREELKHVKSDSAFPIVSGAFWSNTTTGISGKSVPIPYIISDFNRIFWEQCMSLYSKEYSMLNTMESHIIAEAKLQKTIEGEGYHIWHSEDMGLNSQRSRLLAFSLCLNDDYEGGETEFLYQKRRIKPKKDRLLIWPAQFTHTHRGNTVLKGTKYILTGWVEFASPYYGGA